MRIANWHQVTDADWVKTNLLNTTPSGTDGLKNLSETLTVIPVRQHDGWEYATDAKQQRDGAASSRECMRC